MATGGSRGDSGGVSGRAWSHWRRWFTSRREWYVYLKDRQFKGHDHFRWREHLPAEVEKRALRAWSVQGGGGRRRPRTTSWGEVQKAFVVLQPGAETRRGVAASFTRTIGVNSCRVFSLRSKDFRETATGKVYARELRCPLAAGDQPPSRKTRIQRRALALSARISGGGPRPRGDQAPL